MPQRGGTGHAKRPLGRIVAPPRFVAFLILLVAGFFAYHSAWPQAQWKEAAALSFDLATAAFLLSLLPLLADSDADTMRRHARENDANRLVLLLFTSLLTVVVMAAIAGEIKAAQGGDWLAIVKLVVTLTLTWLFANIVYALHYAHMFYAEPAKGGDRGGLNFPETPTPTYSDFCYFAFTLGMTFQTSDVEVTSPAIRRIVLLHSFAAFVFNIGVIAFTINAIGGS